MFVILTKSKKSLHLALVGGCHESGVVQITFTLFAFLRQNVAVVSMFSFDLTGASQCKALLRCAVCLYFWHCCLKLVVINLPRHNGILSILPCLRSLYYHYFFTSLVFLPGRRRIARFLFRFLSGGFGIFLFILFRGVLEG